MKPTSISFDDEDEINPVGEKAEAPSATNSNVNLYLYIGDGIPFFCLNYAGIPYEYMWLSLASSGGELSLHEAFNPIMRPLLNPETNTLNVILEE